MSKLRLCAILLTVTTFAVAADPAPRPPREALQPFNTLVGSWKSTVYPAAKTKAESAKAFWQETVTWGWQFKGSDAWLAVTADKGKHFATGELRYRPKSDDYQLTLTTPEKATKDSLRT